ncbi:MAG TPA: ADP-ribosylglycohydrolase family protein [Actinophytocola sp.]|jgi:ADP-ribosylglycohydrolase|nr:ADP-ribosylglycohydrolase family protein [Actinophytocola sp.]
MDDRLRRARASLRGLAVGDALGGGVVQPAARSLPPAPWRWTDDTEMACSVVHVLAAHGRLDADALAASFVDHHDPDRGYGAGLAAMVHEAGRRGVSLREIAPGTFGGEGSWGNGAAMRVAPLGAWFAGDPATAARAAAESARVTHTHPQGVAGAVATAVAAALAASGAPVGELYDAVLAHTPDGPVHDGVARAATLDADPVRAAATLGTGGRQSAPDTVPLALWIAARHLDDYAEAVWTAAAVADDVDTMCAIVGGVVAARVGAADVPGEWRTACEPLPSWVITTR